MSTYTSASANEKETFTLNEFSAESYRIDVHLKLYAQFWRVESCFPSVTLVIDVTRYRGRSTWNAPWIHQLELPPAVVHRWNPGKWLYILASQNVNGRYKTIKIERFWSRGLMIKCYFIPLGFSLVSYLLAYPFTIGKVLYVRSRNIPGKLYYRILRSSHCSDPWPIVQRSAAPLLSSILRVQT